MAERLVDSRADLLVQSSVEYSVLHSAVLRVELLVGTKAVHSELMMVGTKESMWAAMKAALLVDLMDFLTVVHLVVRMELMLVALKVHYLVAD